MDGWMNGWICDWMEWDRMGWLVPCRSEVCAVLCKSLCECKQVRMRESVQARACRATTGPDSPCCQEAPCSVWLCARAEEDELRMGWLMLFAKMVVIHAL